MAESNEFEIGRGNITAPKPEEVEEKVRATSGAPTAPVSESPISSSGRKPVEYTALDANMDMMNAGFRDYSDVRFLQIKDPDVERKEKQSADYMKLYYPTLSSNIDQARAMGYSNREISAYISKMEAEARFVDGYDQNSIDEFLGRTPAMKQQIKQQVEKDELRFYADLYSDIMTRPEVAELMDVSAWTGIAPNVLVQYPQIYEQAKRMAGVRAGLWKQIAQVGANTFFNWYEAVRTSELKKVSDLEARAKAHLEGNIVHSEWSAMASIANGSDASLDRADMLMRKAREDQAKIDNDTAWLLRQREEWNYRVPLKDSTVGGWLLDIVENTGFSLHALVTSLLNAKGGMIAGGVVGGPVGSGIGGLMGIIRGAYKTSDFESRVEGGAILMEILKENISQGKRSFEDYQQAVADTRSIVEKVYRRNMMLLVPTTAIGDYLTLGMKSIGSRLAKKSVTANSIKELGESIGKSSLAKFDSLPGYMQSAIRRGLVGLNEGGQEFLQNVIQDDARGNPINWNEALYAASVGFGSGVIYSMIGQRFDRANKSDIRNGKPKIDFDEAKQVIGGIADGTMNGNDVIREGEVFFVNRAKLNEVLEGMSREESAAFMTEYQLDEQVAEYTDETGEATSSEYVLMPHEYETMLAKNPALAEALKDDIRSGTKGITANEIIRDAVSVVNQRQQETLYSGTKRANEALDIAKKVEWDLYINSGMTAENASNAGRFYGNFLLAGADMYGVSIDDMHRLQVEIPDSAVKDEALSRGVNATMQMITEVKGKAIFNLFNTGEQQSFYHELWHLGLDNLIAYGALDSAKDDVKLQRSAVLNWLGVSDINFNDRSFMSEDNRDTENGRRWIEAQEKWAREGEKYLAAGKAPNSELQKVFDAIKKFFIDWINKFISAGDTSYSGAELPDNIREVYDRMISIPMGEGSFRDMTYESLDTLLSNLQRVADINNIVDVTGEVNEANSAPVGVSLEQLAFSGGPHRFAEFQLKYVGTGEGAQVYGWGLYFAEQRGISEWYRRKLSRKHKAGEGQLYQVDIPNSDSLLDYDMKMSEQPKEVFDKLVELEKNMKPENTMEDIIKHNKEVIDKIKDIKINDTFFRGRSLLEFREDIKSEISEIGKTVNGEIYKDLFDKYNNEPTDEVADKLLELDGSVASLISKKVQLKTIDLLMEGIPLWDAYNEASNFENLFNDKFNKSQAIDVINEIVGFEWLKKSQTADSYSYKYSIHSRAIRNGDLNGTKFETSLLAPNDFLKSPYEEFFDLGVTTKSFNAKDVFMQPQFSAIYAADEIIREIKDNNIFYVKQDVSLGIDRQLAEAYYNNLDAYITNSEDFLRDLIVEYEKSSDANYRMQLLDTITDSIQKLTQSALLLRFMDKVLSSNSVLSAFRSYDLSRDSYASNINRGFGLFGIDKRLEFIRDMDFGDITEFNMPSDKTGKYVYRELSSYLGSDMKASLALNEAGIPGLQYLDAGSRGNDAENPTHNFVIWNEDTIKILQTFYQKGPDQKHQEQAEKLKQTKQQVKDLKFMLSESVKAERAKGREASKEFRAEIKELQKEIRGLKVERNRLSREHQIERKEADSLHRKAIAQNRKETNQQLKDKQKRLNESIEKRKRLAAELYRERYQTKKARDAFNALKKDHKNLMANIKAVNKAKAQIQKEIDKIKKESKSKSIHAENSNTINDMIKGVDLKKLDPQQITELYLKVKAEADNGRERLRAIQAEKKFRRNMNKQDVINQIKAQKKKLGTDRIITNKSQKGKQYKGVRGQFAKMKDWSGQNILGIDRLCDWLDGMKEGVFTKLFVDDINDAADNEIRNTDVRLDGLRSAMEQVQLTTNDLIQNVEVDGVLTANGNGLWKLDEIGAVYALSKNERGREALLLGTFARHENPELALSSVLNALDNHKKGEAVKAIADYMTNDSERNFDRINQVMINEFNISMRQEKDYFPIMRIGVSQEGQAKNVLGAPSTQGRVMNVSKGFAEERKILDEFKQGDVTLSLYGGFVRQVKTQEHAVAYARVVSDTNALLAARPTKAEFEKGMLGKDDSIKQLISDLYGDNAYKTLLKYAEIFARNEIEIADDALSGISRKLSFNMAATYIFGNFSVLLSQITSLPRFLVTAGPIQLHIAIFEFLADTPSAIISGGKKMSFLEEVYRLDPQIKNRGGGIDLKMLKADPMWGSHKYEAAMDWVTAWIGHIDRWVAAIGWKATYDTCLAKGMSVDEAIRIAKRTTHKTQQPTMSKDAPMLWHSGGVARLLMKFTAESASVLGMGIYDLARAVHNKDIMEFMRTATGLSLSFILYKLLKDGLPDKDDDESWAGWVGEAFLQQYIESIPIIGKDVFSVAQRLMGKQTYNTSKNPFSQPFTRALSGAVGISKNVYEGIPMEEWDTRDIWAFTEGFALLTGLVPHSGIKRAVQAIETGREEDAIKALRVLIGNAKFNKRNGINIR